MKTLKLACMLLLVCQALKILHELRSIHVDPTQSFTRQSLVSVHRLHHLLHKIRIAFVKMHVHYYWKRLIDYRDRSWHN